MSLAAYAKEMIAKTVEETAKQAELTMMSSINARTGALRDSVANVKVNDFHRQVGVDSGKLISDPRNTFRYDYSLDYLFGRSGGQRICAKKGKTLRFIGKDGKVHFRKCVTLGAMQGDDFIQATINKL